MLLSQHITTLHFVCMYQHLLYGELQVERYLIFDFHMPHLIRFTNFCTRVQIIKVVLLSLVLISALQDLFSIYGPNSNLSLAAIDICWYFKNYLVRTPNAINSFYEINISHVQFNVDTFLNMYFNSIVSFLRRISLTLRGGSCSDLLAVRVWLDRRDIINNTTNNQYVLNTRHNNISRESNNYK